MARENNYLAIVLKKQPYGEGDEIITLFTKEAGKIRALAKSTKLPKSKLQYSLQSLFLSRVTTTSASALPKIIRADAVKVYPHVRERMDAAQMAFYALELLLKATADEHKNEGLFALMTDFLEFLNRAAGDLGLLPMGFAKFKMEFLEQIGLGIHYQGEDQPSRVGFSNFRGGFLFEDNSSDYRGVALSVFGLFLAIRQLEFSRLEEVLRHFPDQKDAQELHKLLSGFIRYQLEREINSEKYFES